MLFGVFQSVLGQNKFEKETRIRKKDFPANAFMLIQDQLHHARRIRYYQETDSTKKSFEAKFKKGQLFYSVEFDEEGKLEDIEFTITETDIPEETWTAITEYLTQNHMKFCIKKIQQQYPLNDRKPELLVHEAFQNLILQYINYEIVFAAKKGNAFQFYEALFNAEGKLTTLRKMVSPSYDHVQF